MGQDGTPRALPSRRRNAGGLGRPGEPSRQRRFAGPGARRADGSNGFPGHPTSLGLSRAGRPKGSLFAHGRGARHRPRPVATLPAVSPPRGAAVPTTAQPAEVVEDPIISLRGVSKSFG